MNARWKAILAGVVVAAVLVVAVSVTISSFQSKQVKQTNATVESCRQVNELRAADHDLWQYVITLSQTSPRQQDPESQAKLKAFQDRLDTVFAQVDCGALVRP